jgi:hypothetical protein
MKPREACSFLVKQDNNRDTCIAHFWRIYGLEREYALRCVCDADNGTTLRNLRKVMRDEVRGDFLNAVSESRFSVKREGESGVFLYPETLTASVLKVTRKNLNNLHDGDSQRGVLEEFLAGEPEWVGELEEFLVG